MKLLIVLILILCSDTLFAWGGTGFVAIRMDQDSGGVMLIERSNLRPFISRDGLAVWIYQGWGPTKDLIATVTFKSRGDTVWWLKENFEPKCMTKKKFEKCDPTDAPVLNER